MGRRTVSAHDLVVVVASEARERLTRVQDRLVVLPRIDDDERAAHVDRTDLDDRVSAVDDAREDTDEVEASTRVDVLVVFLRPGTAVDARRRRGQAERLGIEGLGRRRRVLRERLRVDVEMLLHRRCVDIAVRGTVQVVHGVRDIVRRVWLVRRLR